MAGRSDQLIRDSEVFSRDNFDNILKKGIIDGLVECFHGSADETVGVNGS